VRLMAFPLRTMTTKTSVVALSRELMVL
jgi:hypothetical protein